MAGVRNFIFCKCFSQKPGNQPHASAPLRRRDATPDTPAAAWAHQMLQHAMGICCWVSSWPYMQQILQSNGKSSLLCCLLHQKRAAHWTDAPASLSPVPTVQALTKYCSSDQLLASPPQSACRQAIVGYRNTQARLLRPGSFWRPCLLCFCVALPGIIWGLRSGWMPGCQSWAGRPESGRGWRPERGRAATRACMFHSHAPHGACATVT